MTWRELAVAVPHFVQWVVQRHGGVPDGPVRQEDYDRFAAEYYEEHAEESTKDGDS